MMSHRCKLLLHPLCPLTIIVFLTRAELVERYAARSGQDVTHIKFYHLLGMFRVTVIVAQIYICFHRGQTQDQRFASFGLLTKNLAQAANAMI
jgi:aminoglycoside phosphotransferase (APT) family kinase protein